MKPNISQKSKLLTKFLDHYCPWKKLKEITTRPFVTTMKTWVTIEFFDAWLFRRLKTIAFENSIILCCSFLITEASFSVATLEPDYNFTSVSEKSSCGGITKVKPWGVDMARTWKEVNLCTWQKSDGIWPAQSTINKRISLNLQSWLS